MQTNRSFCLSLIGLMLLVGCRSGSEETSGAAPVTIALTRIVRIPVALWSEAESEADLVAVAIVEGAEDELPQGPQGFDVLSDGSFVVTDPLRKRLAFFDQQGRFSRALELRFAADSVSFTADNQLQVRRASAADRYLVDESGAVSALPPAGQRSADAGGQARLLSPGRGVISQSAGQRGDGGTIEILHEDSETRMVSLQNLGVDESGYTYVAIETTAGGMAIDVSKAIRKYNPEGALVGEIRDIPIDYYVVPVDEFRIRRQTVYHLVPLPGELRIYVWDTAQTR